MWILLLHGELIYYDIHSNTLKRRGAPDSNLAPCWPGQLVCGPAEPGFLWGPGRHESGLSQWRGGSCAVTLYTEFIQSSYRAERGTPVSAQWLYSDHQELESQQQGPGRLTSPAPQCPGTCCIPSVCQVFRCVTFLLCSPELQTGKFHQGFLVPNIRILTLQTKISCILFQIDTYLLNTFTFVFNVRKSWSLLVMLVS